MPPGDEVLVLRRAGEQALAAGHTLLDPDALIGACRPDGLSGKDVFAALRSLSTDRLVDLHFVGPSRVTLLRLTAGGVRRHLGLARPDLADVRRRVLDALEGGGVAWQDGATVDLAGAVGEPALLVEVVMEDLRQEGRVVFSPAPGQRLRVHRLSSPAAVEGAVPGPLYWARRVDQPDSARASEHRGGHWGVAASEERSPREAYVLGTLARQASVVDDVEASARATTGQPERATAWMGVARQVERYLGDVAVWRRARRLTSLAPDIEAHRRALAAVARAARDEVAGLDDATRAAARDRLGLRLAVVGKGGAGKTMISATLARLLARRGRPVLAADLDTNPGLAFSLGLGLGDGASGVPLALEEHSGAMYGWQLEEGVTPAVAVGRFAAEAPDGVRFLSVGKIDDPDKREPKRTIAAVRQILGGFGEPGWDVIGDLEAGPTTPFERYHAFADRVIVVVGPAWRSALTARRLLPIIGDVPVVVVANRFRDEPDHPGLEAVLRVPFDPDVAEAERLGLAPLDHCPRSPAVRAVERLAELFLPQEVAL